MSRFEFNAAVSADNYPALAAALFAEHRLLLAATDLRPRHHQDGVVVESKTLTA